MEKKTNHTNNHSRRRWPWIVLFGLIGVAGLARLSLKTGIVQQWAKGLLLNTANDQLIPELSIETISGDLWKRLTFTNIALTEGEAVIASVDTLRLTYDPLSYFGDTLRVREVSLTRPVIHLQQQPDSTWNFQHWVDTGAGPADTTDGGLVFSLSQLSIHRGMAEILMPGLRQDSSFTIDQLTLAGSAGYYGENYEASIHDLSFVIRNTRLDSLITFESSLNASETSVTLEKLALATGYSMISASGHADLADSTVQLQTDLSPLGWKDLAVYMEDLPLKQDLDASLALEGSIADFKVRLDADAPGINQLTLNSHFRGDASLAMTSIEVVAEQLHLDEFTGDTVMPQLQKLEFRADGNMPIGRPEEGRMEGAFSARNIRQGIYRVDLLEGSFDLNRETADIHLESVVDGEQLLAEAELERIWEETPGIHAVVHGNRINPGSWLQDETYAGNITFRGEIDGVGWYPEKEYWQYHLAIDDSRMMEQRLDRARFSGRFNGQGLTMESRLSVNESRIDLQAEVRALQSVPAFSYTASGTNLNLADLRGMEDYRSSLFITLEGTGRGKGLGDMEVHNTLKADSSTFMGESVKELLLDVQLSDTIARINNGRLESSIAAGTLNGRLYLQDLYNEHNRLNLNMEIKDLSSLAPIAEVEVLQATGTLHGELAPEASDLAVFEGEINLEEVNYDNRLQAPEISGRIRVGLSENADYMADFDILRPTVASEDLQNISLYTRGQRSETSISGSFEAELAGSKEERIDQSGKYRISGDSLSMEWSRFDLTSQLRTLSLQKPFHASWSGGRLQTDTLHISNENGSAFMELAVPSADSMHQRAYVNAERLNLRVIQDAILEKAYFSGMLSGELEMDRTDTSLVASGNLLMLDLLYQETLLDTLRLEGQIDDERLQGAMALHQDGELIAEGELDIPFKAENPELLEESFFEEPVNGALVLHAIKLGRFGTLLEQAGYENTKGTLRFSGRLEGKAGQPKLDAELNLQEAQLSGVPIDSLIASVHYQHAKSNLVMNAMLTSLKQKALQMDARMPLDIDLRSWQARLPGPQDSVSMSVWTNQFNLKALNDFLNRDEIANLQGQVNGQVDIAGARDNLKTTGEIRLQRGALRIVPAGIRLDNMESVIRFRPDQIELANLSMKSGSGNLNARGTMGLEKLVPGNLDFTVTAQNFKVANTSEYNGIINLKADVKGSVSQPRLSGKLDVVNGFVELDNFGEKSVEEVSLDTTVSMEPDISLYDSLSLDMDIGFNRRFYVRNQRYLEMELELDGQIDLLKEAGRELQMFGTLNTATGYAEPLGKRFELEEGSLAFSGPIDNPQINIRTLYEPPQTDQEIRIWYIIEGTVEDPQFKYESSPPMDLAGIISYTLFGQPFYKLDPAEQSVASTSSNTTAADFAVEVLMDKVESLATQHLGIDVVRIENTHVGGETGTSISTGWYINPKVFFAIHNVIAGSTPTTGFYLEYYLKENLRLILSQGNNNRQGIDMQWEYDY
ncbi:translocation/assembly module TamB domain-containing protein [Fodinibius sediminis]|uniref:Translocation and assembly module TamB C-terminal domain-containing protein n=1 Tax=Fodinibius sediminis TaxID=1214077 RepID=A0A521C7L4_9BACT|nr:translocation/assembly module TamB [Fodinibius sediminis]SMO55384.1 Family of unknown function [Fodinibius sediminis]